MKQIYQKKPPPNQKNVHHEKQVHMVAEKVRSIKIDVSFTAEILQMTNNEWQLKIQSNIHVLVLSRIT